MCGDKRVLGRREQWRFKREEGRPLILISFSFLAGEAGTDRVLVSSVAFSALLRPARFTFFKFFLFPLPFSLFSKMRTEFGASPPFPPFRFVAALNGVPPVASYAAPPVAASVDYCSSWGCLTFCCCFWHFVYYWSGWGLPFCSLFFNTSVLPSEDLITFVII